MNKIDTFYTCRVDERCFQILIKWYLEVNINKFRKYADSIQFCSYFHLKRYSTKEKRINYSDQKIIKHEYGLLFL